MATILVRNFTNDTTLDTFCKDRIPCYLLDEALTDVIIALKASKIPLEELEIVLRAEYTDIRKLEFRLK